MRNKELLKSNPFTGFRQSSKRGFRFTLVLFALHVFWTSVEAQEQLVNEITNVVPPDVEVAKLWSFGGFNQNLATGQLDVNVPIHVLHGISLQHPISLSYNPTGIRVEDRATSVGLNWSLIGVSVITKTVVGQPDELTSFGYNTTYSFAHLFNSGTYTPTDIANDKVLQTSQGRFDLEPDYFSFSFNGRGGKFYYDPATSQYYTMPYSKLSITKSTAGDGGEFQVIDEKGFKYIFGNTSECYNSYGTYGGDDYSSNYTSQWYLSKVYAPDGNLEFSFEYIQGPLVNEQGSTSQTLKYLQSTTGCGAGGSSGIMQPSGGSTSFSNVSRLSLLLSKIICPMETASFYYKDRLDGSLRLDSISFSKNGRENENWRLFHSYYTGANKLRLDSICQYSNLIKIGKYNFDYDPTPIPQTDSKSRDLWGYYNGQINSSLVPKIWYGQQYIGNADRSPDITKTKSGVLNKITYPTGGSSEFIYELNDYGSVEQPSRFEDEPIKIYSTKHISRRYLNEGSGTSTLTFTLDQTEIITFTTFRDQCNNRTNVCSNDPCTVQLKLVGNGSTISLNGTARQGFSKILNLQPGTYTVEVTTNDYQEYGEVMFSIPQTTGYNKKIAAGGLRIKKVINYDPITDQYSVRKFEYTVKDDPSRSSGTILSKPNFVYTNSMGTRCSGGATIPSCESWLNFVIITSNSTTDLSFSDGSPVAYTRVIERIGDNGEGGSIEHIFSYASDGLTRAFPFPAPSSRSWKRGLPLQTNYISAVGDTTSREVNEYYSEPSRNFHRMTGYKAGLSAYCPYYAGSVRVAVAPMNYTSEWFYLKKNIKISYGLAGQSPVENATEYFYDNQAHLQTTKIKTKLSNGGFHISYLKYPLDYVISSGATDESSSALYKMQSKHMIEYPVEQTEYVSNGTQEIIKKGNLYLYKEFFDNGIYNSKAYEFVSEAPTLYSLTSSDAAGIFTFSTNYKFRFEANAYNTKGKLTEFTNVGGLKKAIMYHSNGLLPIALITNAASNQVYYDGFEESTLPTVSSFSKYGRKSNNGVYVVAGTSLIPGAYTKCWWEYIDGKWIYNSVPFTHNGTDNFVFGSGNLIDNVSVYPQTAELESYDYDLSEGLISKVKPNGDGIKFKYDSLLRLQSISDHNNNAIKSYDYHYKTN